MAQTFSGTVVPYATQQDMVNRCDSRTLGDWLSDNDNRLDLAAVLASSLLNTLLLAGSGDVELATYAGQRYQLADLQAIMTYNGGVSAQFELLKDLVCLRTLPRLIGRRPHIIFKQPQWVQDALVMLNQLRQGERIFGFVQSAQAGKDVLRLQDGPMIARVATPWLGTDSLWPTYGWGGGYGSCCGWDC
jgi:hypothetical protein